MSINVKKIYIHGLYDFVNIFIHEHFRNVMKLFISAISLPPKNSLVL